MNKTNYLLIFLLLLILPSFTSSGYDSSYVAISAVGDYYLVYMEREASNKRIKVKYFCAKDSYTGASVADRYNKWKVGKNIICVTSGTYMTKFDYTKPEGLSVDNGVIVNRTIENYDGLVIVYATGGIVVSNLEHADLKVSGNGLDGKVLDVRNDSWDRSEFLDWAESEEATVFQTHLLVYKNNIEVSKFNSEPTRRERRFLVVGYDEDDQLVHLIIHMPEANSLYDGTEKVLDFLLEYKDMNEVTFMLNLDTGMQNIFELYNSDGSKNSLIEGEISLSDAANLLIYYYD